MPVPSRLPIEPSPHESDACRPRALLDLCHCRHAGGRAGRVQPGECFYMYTHERCAGLAPYQLPEMHRTPLHELCLQIKLLELGEIEDFLAKALEPPAADAVRAAVVTLAELQALDPQQSLTPLGHHLATLPCDVRIGKMLLFACMLRCLHPVLVIAAGLSVRSPWLTPFDKREASTQARRTFAATTRSDHLALLRAYEGYRRALGRGAGAAKLYCAENFLSPTALQQMEQVGGRPARAATPCLGGGCNPMHSCDPCLGGLQPYVSPGDGRPVRAAGRHRLRAAGPCAAAVAQHGGGRWRQAPRWQGRRERQGQRQGQR